jgi:hypothetical protein
MSFTKDPVRVRSGRAPLLAAATLAVLALPAAAGAKGAPSIYTSKDLWATVNICDTADHPDTVGIRGSMPGSGFADERMFMRFQLQYFRASDKRWHNIGTSGDAGFIAVGSGRFKKREAGRNFTVRPPSSGSFILRGAVTFEWRKDGEVVRRARKRTRSGHVGTRGADPADFSAATCEVRQAARAAAGHS